MRLAVTLALFFVIPAVGFTIWGLGRLTDETNRIRDLLITSALRDAVLTAGGLLQEPMDYLSEGLSSFPTGWRPIWCCTAADAWWPPAHPSWRTSRWSIPWLTRASSSALSQR